MKAVCALRLLVLAVFAATLPGRVSGIGFPIATNPQPEHTWAIAFDGTNFLVGVQQSNPPSPGMTGAKLVAASGAVLATAFAPRTGDTPHIAFDGTNYLLVWADHTPPSLAGVPVYGQFVSRQGSLVGSPFLVSQSTTIEEVDGVAFDGTKYLVLWTDVRRVVTPPQPGGKDVYGRFVSTTGAATGSDFKVSDGAGRESTLAFGAPSYLAIWNEDVNDAEVRGRFVTPAGDLQPAFTVNGSSALSDNETAVAFDGTNFLVVWGDGNRNDDLFAQRVSPTAALVGSPIPIVTAPGFQTIPYIAFDGINYLVTWTDLANDANGNFTCDLGEGTCADVYGQFLSPSGSLIGANFAVTVDPDNQVQAPVAYGGGKYLVAWNDRFMTSSADVFGIFLSSSERIFSDGFETGALSP